MRHLALGLVSAFALGGCAVSNATYPRQPAPVVYAPAPAVPNDYTTAASAPLHSDLFPCNAYGSNLGEIGYRGESANYTPYIETAAGPLLRNPTESACLSSGFGWRGGENGRPHNGLDLANPGGGYIYAAGAGRVRFADWRGGYGLMLEIDHGAGVRTVYAHLAEIDPNLSSGAYVEAGAPVARMGRTGNATGVHLHYEVWIDGMLVDPLHYGRPPQYVTTPVTDATLTPLDDGQSGEAGPDAGH